MILFSPDKAMHRSITRVESCELKFQWDLLYYEYLSSLLFQINYNWKFQLNDSVFV